MATTLPNAPLPAQKIAGQAGGATKLVVARVPYLNCAPFFYGLSDGGEGWEWADATPRQLGAAAEAGQAIAGPMAVADFLRLQDRYERVGHLGIAVRGRCGSTTLFSRAPIHQLDGATIAVTEQTSTTGLLLRLILEQRYHVFPTAYRRGPAEPQADAVLLIGDDALRFGAANRSHPFEIDIAFEWWLWQHLPCVFAVWAVQKACPAPDKHRLARLLQHQLAVNLGRLDVIAGERAPTVGLVADDVRRYLANFVYRLSEPEERAIKQFEALVHAHRLL